MPRPPPSPQRTDPLFPYTPRFRSGLLPLGGKDRAARVGRRTDEAAIRPGLEIFDGIDDSAAELSVGRPGAVGAMLLKRALGQSEETSGFLRAQVAWRDAGGSFGHCRASVVSSGTAAVRRRFESTVA